MALRGILFDMGGTLLHYNVPGTVWEDTEKKGAHGIYTRLQAAGVDLPPEDQALERAWDFTLALWTRLDRYTPQDLKLNRVMAQLLAAWDISDPSPQIVASAAEAYMTAIQADVVPLDGALATLQTLRDQGLRIGLISNTLWPGDVHRADLDRYGLTPFLEHLIFSADVEAWKPHSAIFQMGLDALDLHPSETAYIGDSLYFDVWGAQQAGLRGVWIEQTQPGMPDGLDVTPDATLKTLPDLLTIVNEWL